MRLPQGALIGAVCLVAGAVAQEETFPAMEFVMPLYIAPTYLNGTVASQWVTLHETALMGVTVFGILNPASGPGTVTGENYTTVITSVKDAGAKLLCYVATTYGNKTAASVEEEIKAYQTLYPNACDGIFFDEAPYILGSSLDLYTAHNTFAHATLDGTEEARVVFNTGQAPDEQYFAFSPPAEVLGYENYYKTVRQLGMPETSDASVPNQNMLFIHSATELANKSTLIQPFMNKAYCKGWGTVYITDDLFDGGNPWDDPPTFWQEMILASKNIPSVASCGNDGFKVLVPLLGSDPADTDAIIATADPGDYGDRITVAMNVEITESGESTTRAAAVRDAGAKVLCYIEADEYGNDLSLLEEVVTTFTYFPLNEICAGFFFGAFNVVSAIEDMAGLQSLYAKTQKTFLQATVVFAPEVEDTTETDFSFGFSYSFGYDFDDGDLGDAWDTSGWDFFFPWEDVMTPTDVVALAEALVLGLDTGSTTGDIIVADTLDGTSVVPTSSGPAKHTAGLVVGNMGMPDDIIFDLFVNGWGYGYVTEFDDFEALTSQWAAVVDAASATETVVV